MTEDDLPCFRNWEDEYLRDTNHYCHLLQGHAGPCQCICGDVA